MYKRKWIILAIPIVLVLIFILTFIPHKVVKIDPNNVSKITVFDGNTGNEIEITDNNDISHIINNLNNVTFQKEKLSIGYMGFNFRATIFDSKGNEIKSLIINSSKTIRYRGFFYRSTNIPIDYNYIEKLVEPIQ
ncbi:hypothetical protein [Aquibacillus kalidii]|uniref:hypothetical protein n=1 Tax=Aquibacillus kalidii TaxID=2762597 RepID=UPI0016481760|nr:hypothetical protein [Aquibacillus kalidii]